MKKVRITTLISMLILLAVGCAPVKMMVPPGLGDSSDTYPVDRPKIKSSIGKQEFKMGPYTAKEVDLGGTGSKSVGVGGFSKGSSNQDLSFTIEGLEGMSIPTTCVIASSSMAIGGFGKSTRTMECSFGEADKLRLGFDSQDGTITAAAGQLNLTITKAREGSDKPMSSPTGYLFYSGEALVGAADINNQGIVYMNTNLDEGLRILIAGSATALLLYEN